MKSRFSDTKSRIGLMPHNIGIFRDKCNSSAENDFTKRIFDVQELGSTADRKIHRRYWSYSVFIGGNIPAVASLLILASMKWTDHLPPL